MILNPGYGFILGGEARAFAQTLIINTWDLALINNMVGWPNGKALDYESRDCRFDPCVDHNYFLSEDHSFCRIRVGRPSNSSQLYLLVSRHFACGYDCFDIEKRLLSAQNAIIGSYNHN